MSYALWLIGAIVAPLLAGVKASPLAFGSMFQDGAVLQREKKVTVWGTGPSSADVQLTLSPVGGGTAHSQVLCTLKRRNFVCEPTFKGAFVLS